MMAGEPKNIGESATSTDTETKKTEKKKGVLSRLWNAIFRLHGDDFEKRLQHISEEEAVVVSRISKRSHTWQRVTMYLIGSSVLLELVAVVYAIVTTRSVNLNWKMRALRVLLIFLLPSFCLVTYAALRSFTKMCDRKDRSTLEKLRAERQAKIDELKKKTNYYSTQQLIQKYDPDPTTKAAAATILASKLGADSGLKLYVGDGSKPNEPTGKSSDVEVAKTSGGLRKRKQPHSETSSMESALTYQPNESISDPNSAETSQQRPLVVEHHPQSGPSARDDSWIARFAALLVGEDPAQSYALICGNCHMHNGLARKEDFPYVMYYCPHCKALNKPTQSSGDQSNGPALEPPDSAQVGSPSASAEGSDADDDTAGDSSPHAVKEPETSPSLSLS